MKRKQVLPWHILPSPPDGAAVHPLAARDQRGLIGAEGALEESTLTQAYPLSVLRRDDLQTGACARFFDEHVGLFTNSRPQVHQCQAWTPCLTRDLASLLGCAVKIRGSISVRLEHGAERCLVVTYVLVIKNRIVQ